MDSTKKPVWPHSSICTLTPHPSGSWCKKVGGKMKYFGPIGNPDLALRRYLDFASSLANDRPQQEVLDKSEISLNLAMNKFLNERQHDVEKGELSAGQYARYRSITTHTLGVLGRTRPFASLQPADFAQLRRTLSGGPVSVKNKITWIRTIFHWAEEYYGVKVAYGGMFDKPSRRAIEQGSRRRRLFAPEEIQAMLKIAGPTVKPFLLLGINCGFGQSDIATLRKDAVDLVGGVIRHPRGKTAIKRINPIWPETVQALKEYIRPSTAHPDLFFITRFGEPFVREPAKLDAAGIVKSTTYIDSLSQEFDKLMDLAEVPRRGFYTLRHTFRSVADNVADTTAIECLMGHLKAGMGGVYTQLMANGMQRLAAVTNHVRQWAIGSTIKEAHKKRPKRG